jgi:hypothetical protein
MKLFQILVCIVLASLVAACNLNSSSYSSTQESAAHPVERKQAAFIEQGYAALRKQQIISCIWSWTKPLLPLAAM